jgi:hypothetical protein
MTRKGPNLWVRLAQGGQNVASTAQSAHGFSGSRQNASVSSDPRVHLGNVGPGVS